MAMLLFLLAAQAGRVEPVPSPGPIKTFGDWVVACDNVRTCEMTSLWPGETQPESGSPYDQVSVSVVRAAGPTTTWTVDIQLPGKTGPSPLRITTEQGQVARAVPKDDMIRLTGADAAKVIAAMAAATDLRIGDETSVLGMASLKGASASLRFIDAEQGRAGTVTAAVARGPKPASAVPPARAVPSVPQLRPAGVAAKITPALARSLFAQTKCGENYEAADRPQIETAALGGGATLALVPCGAGAYNFASVAMILRGGKAVRARFDLTPGFTGEAEAEPMLVNAGFDAKTGQLASYAKGRGIGDCGNAETYVWDGSRFRAVEARTMGECRGSVNWLATWRATGVMR